MGAHNTFFNSGTPTPGDGVFYYYVTTAELENLTDLWAEFADDFCMRRPGEPDIWYAYGGSIDEFEQGLLDGEGCLRGIYLLSNQPVVIGG